MIRAGLLLLFLFARSGFATEIYYPGTFDLFHLTHFNEVSQAEKLTPDASVTILPIESAYYNTRDGLQEPRVVPYDLSLKVSNDLRKIDSDVLRKLTDYLARSSDPDKRLLIGADVLKLWSGLDGFDQLKSKVTFVVDEDPRDAEQNAKLEQSFKNDSKVVFVHADDVGIRSSKVLDLLISQPEQALNLLPAGYRDYFAQNPNELKKLVWGFSDRLETYVRKRAVREVVPLLAAQGFDHFQLEEMEHNQDFMNALVTTDPNRPGELDRLYARYQAVTAGLRKSGDVTAKFENLLRSREFQELPSKKAFDYLRSFRAQIHVPKPELASKVSPPRYLFHWTDDTTLQRQAKYNPDPDRLPLRMIKDNSLLATQYPELTGKDGLFGWINPLTAMASDKKEIYAWREGDTPARMIAVKPKPDASVIELDTRIGSKPKHVANLADYDLIYNHVYSADGKLLFSEWIVRNPNAIESFTSDPEAIRPLMEAELKKLKTPGFHYPESEYFADFRDSKFWIETGEDFLKKGSKGIPESLRRPLGPDACEVRYNGLRAN
jgi:hypothetical protein